MKQIFGNVILRIFGKEFLITYILCNILQKKKGKGTSNWLFSVAISNAKILFNNHANITQNKSFFKYLQIMFLFSYCPLSRSLFFVELLYVFLLKIIS